MISLQKLFSKDEEFFKLLEASAEECQASIRALKQIVASGAPPTLAELNVYRRKDKKITTEINQLLCRVSVTSFESEDIEALSNALYKIPKTVEKFAERYVANIGDFQGIDFSRQLNLLEQAIEIIVTMLKEIRDKFQMERIAEQNEKLQRIEGEADDLILKLLIELYRCRNDPVKVIIVKDQYELLEKVVDRCRDAGNVISQIVLKNS